ncbi:MAG: hypothetical protein AB7V46_02995 [Thermomicrobiales bacterium]
MNFLFNVYDRYDELEVNIRCLRRTLPNAFVGVYHNGNRDRVIDAEIDQLIWGENSGHHNGTRDAYNAFTSFVKDDECYACIHADVWCSDYRLYSMLETGMRGKRFGFMDPGPTGAMHNPQHMGYYADMFIIRGDGYKRIFPIEEELDGREWIETTLYSRVWGRAVPYEIWEIPNTCERSHHRDKPFVFTNQISREDFILSGDQDVFERVKSLTGRSSNDPYGDIFEEFLERRRKK